MGAGTMYNEITLQLLESCNLRCPYCFAPKETENILTMKDFYTFYDFCNNSDLQCIHITGGEPSLHPHFKEIVEHLNRKFPLVIYSNFTLPLLIENLDLEHSQDVFFLVNLNNRYLYKGTEYDNLINNIVIAKEKGIKIAVGHTFYQRDFLEEFNNLIDFAKKFRIRNIRLSQSISAVNETYDCNRKTIADIYAYAAENADFWHNSGFKVYFDCPVPPCYIRNEDFAKLRKYSMVGIRCLPKVFVRWNMQITHCYSTFGTIYGKKITDFSNLEEIQLYIKSKLFQRANSSQCYNKGCMYYDSSIFCGCPNYNNGAEREF